jgi:hypothetical protein
MIVRDPPYDLVALFSDLDMQKLFEELVERGQEPGRRCARRFRWRSLRDPRRDTVWSQPERVLLPFIGTGCSFLIAWDHSGSGRESESRAGAGSCRSSVWCRTPDRSAGEPTGRRS